jgi:hypothetical protein
MKTNPWDALKLKLNTSRVDWDAVARLMSEPIIEPPLFALDFFMQEDANGN